MNNDPLIANESQPTDTMAEMVRADERLKKEFPLITSGFDSAWPWTMLRNH
jgi:hypothetical protein